MQKMQLGDRTAYLLWLPDLPLEQRTQMITYTPPLIHGNGLKGQMVKYSVGLKTSGPPSQGSQPHPDEEYGLNMLCKIRYNSQAGGS